MGAEMLKTVRLTDDELSSYFGDFTIFKNGMYCDMVRIPNEYPDLLPDLVFSRRLPQLCDGSFLNPTVMIPISLELLKTILGEVPVHAIQAWVLFGDYYPDERAFWVTRTTKNCALIKIQWDVRISQIVDGEVLQSEEPGGLGHEVPSERLKNALKLVVNVDDDYGLHGVTYAMVELDCELWRLYRKCDESTRNMLQDSAEKLERFEAEKEEWKEKIMGLIPKNWVDVSPSTRRMESKEDFVRLWVETSPAYWQAIVTSRFDEVGYQKMVKAFS